MTVRTYKPGDELAQVSIYNAAAGRLPRFKPTSVDEIRRRFRGPDFDPKQHFYAIADGQVMGYAHFHDSGRISFPWCRPGYESLAELLLERVLDEMRQRQMRSAFAAYRSDWRPVAQYLEDHDFRHVRDMVSYVIDLAEMPTPAALPPARVSPLVPEEIDQILKLGEGVIRVDSSEALRKHLFEYLGLPPEAIFSARGRTADDMLAVALLIENKDYADPLTLDAGMPCFRFGAFGTEGLTHKRVNGLFSFVCRPERDAIGLGLDLLGQTVFRMKQEWLSTLTAQVPSDAAHLMAFYERFFKRQGAFPIFERSL